MERIPVVMVRAHLRDLPSCPLPEGYRIRAYRRGEELLWAEIESAAGEFRTPEAALAHFEEEFGPYRHKMESRCLFLEHESNRVIGTTTAWRNRNFQGEEYGRIHWVGIHPDFQGKGLSKPLVGAAMQRLARSHVRAYLTTQTTSWKAIKVYLSFGFAPLLTNERCEEGWRLLASLLRHPALKRYLAHTEA